MLTYCPVRLLAFRAATKDLHPALSRVASFWMVPQLWPVALSSDSTVLRHVVLGRPLSNVAPVGCQLAAMALKMNTVTIPKGGRVARQKFVTRVWDVSQCIWVDLHETRGISATLAVNRLGHVSALYARYFNCCSSGHIVWTAILLHIYIL